MSEGTPLDEPPPADAPPEAEPATEAPAAPPPKGFSADARLLAIATPLGERAVEVHSLHGEEGLSRLFHFDLELAFTDSAADPRALLGKGVTLRLRLGKDARYLNGLICRIAQAPTAKQANLHRATMVPWLWLLTRSADCRIFQNLSVPAIVERVFEERGFKDYQLRLQRTYPPREYCVQYHETDFNFVSRLLEHAGIWYAFEHENGRHVLVLGDAPSEHKPFPGQPQARFSRSKSGAVVDAITGWAVAHELRPTRYALGAFNFETPSVHLGVSVDSVYESPVGGRSEVYEYPGGYDKRPDGEALVRTRIEEEEAQALTIHGSSTCRGFVAGASFELTDHPVKEQNRAYALVWVEHHAKEPGKATLEEDEPSYRNRFLCLPAEVPFRPRRVTPRPVIHGAQTALVVGKTEEELWADKHGRVKVQFHWDRQGKRDENSSCWMRVAQLWAGKRYGSMFLPRVGQEVLVEFLEGDPDNPVITGRLYNGDNPPPYDLPADQTKSTIKGASSKGGGGFNELRFEDKKGAEQIFLHGERDLDLVVKRDGREWIGGDRHLIVSKSLVQHVKNESHLKVDGNKVEEVGGAQSWKAAKEIYVSSGTRLVIEAGGSITLKGAGGFVQIDQSGVVIQGTLVNINSGGSAVAGAALKLRAPDKASSAGAAGSGEGAEETPEDSKPDYALVVAYYEEQMKTHGDKMTPEDKEAANKALDDLRAAAALGDGAAVLASSQKLHKTLEKTAGHPIAPPPGFKAAGVDKDGHTVLAPDEEAKAAGAPGGPMKAEGGTARSLQGPFRVENGAFVDGTGPRLPVGCHAGDLFLKWVTDKAKCEAALNEIARAGYHFIRTWTRLRGQWWKDKAGEVGQELTPNYWDQMAAFTAACGARGLRLHYAAGDLAFLNESQRTEYYAGLRDHVAKAGVDRFVLIESLNEARDCGERDPAKHDQYMRTIRERHPQLPAALSVYTGHEDLAEFKRWTPEWQRFLLVHIGRDGRYYDKLRHVFNLGYELAPAANRSLVWHGEPWGVGKRVSAIANQGELDDEVMGAAVAISLLSGGIWVYFCSPGIIYDEPFASQQGFAVSPKIAARLEAFGADMMRWRRIHGHPTRPNSIVIDGTPDFRVDQTIAGDGRIVAVAHGPSGSYKPTVRSGRYTVQVIDPGTDTVESTKEVGAGDTIPITFKRARLLLATPLGRATT